MEEKNTLAMELMHELKKSSKRNFIIAIILLIALVVSNIAWLIYEAQWEVVADTETTTVDGGENGSATYLENSESGDINYGKDSKN